MSEDFRAVRCGLTYKILGHSIQSYNQWMDKLMDMHTKYPSLGWDKYVPSDPNPFPAISLFPRNWFAKPIKSWP